MEVLVSWRRDLEPFEQASIDLGGGELIILSMLI